MKRQIPQTATPNVAHMQGRVPAGLLEGSKTENRGKPEEPLPHTHHVCFHRAPLAELQGL